MKKRIVLFLCIILMLFLVTALFYYFTTDYFFYKEKQQKLQEKFTKSTLSATIDVRFNNKPKPTKLIIPKIEFKQYVVYAKGDLQSQMKALKSGPTHYGGTALPGQKGNMIIGGHYVWYAFKYLNKLKKDDFVNIQVPGQMYKYKVIETKIVNENTLEEVKRYGKNKKNLLTLYTCVYPSWKTKERFLVIAEQYSP